jgi:protein-S-isoprenylcysteine O-methyltransferase Ste14
MCALLFGTAGTTRYWPAWVYVSIFVAASVLTSLYLMKRDPSLLARRMRGGPIFEKEGTQRIIMIFTSLGFIALLVVSALDHRFGWSSVPVWLVVLGDVLVAIGFYFIFLVYRENSFAAATIEVSLGQEVIATGPYAVVRHPMYASGSLYILGTPLALGSYWGFLALAATAPFLLWRLFDEERILTRDLPGYAEYRQRVRHRLVPMVVVATTDMSQDAVVIRRAEVTDLSKVETVARATWPAAYAGIIPDEVQRRLLDRLVLTGQLESRAGGARIEFLRRRIEWRCHRVRAVRSSIGTVGGAHAHLRVAGQATERGRDAVARRRAHRIGAGGPGIPDRRGRARQRQRSSLLRAGRFCGAARAHSRRAGI